MSNTSEISIDQCSFLAYNNQPPEQIRARFWLNSVFGSGLAFLGVLGNLLLAFALFRRKNHRESHFVYYAILAVFDLFVSLSYIMMNGIYDLIVYMVLEDIMIPLSIKLIRAWLAYFRLVITASHVSSVAASYLILASFCERYTLTSKHRFLPFMLNNRAKLALGAVALGFVMKGSMYAEFTVIKLNCTDHMAYWPQDNSDLGDNYVYSKLFKFYLRNFVCILFPFAMLCILNVKIVYTLKTQHHKASVMTQASGEHKKRIRDATRMLLIVVAVYLATNSLNVLITIWEYLDRTSLLTQYVTFYNFSTDLISLCVTFSAVLRLPLYLLFNAEMRQAILDGLRWLICQPESNIDHVQTQNTTITTVKLANNDHFINNNLNNQANGKADLNGHEMLMMDDYDCDEVML